MLTFGLACAHSTASIHDNYRCLESQAVQAKEMGCTALCFPECFLTGYAPAEASVRAIERSSEYLYRIRPLAAELSMDLLVGFMEKEHDHFFITQGIFLADQTVSFYRKTHLGEREALVFAAGDSLDPFTLSCGVRIGIQLCVETHFHEITQTLSLKGARLIFAPHAVPRAAGDRKTIWGKYIPARSYDNQVYLACCNLWDEERFGGGLLVSGPNGEILTSCFEDRPSVLTFSVSAKTLLASEPPKPKHYFPARRRPELYTIVQNRQ